MLRHDAQAGLTAEGDVAEGEEASERVEGKVAAGTLGVVESTGARGRDREVAAGNHEGCLLGGESRATDGAGNHCAAKGGEWLAGVHRGVRAMSGPRLAVGIGINAL